MVDGTGKKIYICCPMNQAIDKIIAIAPHQNREDRMVWMGEMDGLLNMKSVCQCLNTNATKSQKTQNQVFKGIWR